MLQQGAAATFGAVERLERARRLGLLVGRVYLGIKANQVLARGLSRDQMRRRWRRFHSDSAENVYQTAVDLRGLVLKGCQYLGARADLMPREWVDVLSRLQDRVPPRGLPEIRRVVERELGRPLDAVFLRFSPRPVASASLAQVHEAVLHDGSRVAVKVQYPEIADLVRSDLANLRALFRAIGWLEPDFDLMPLVDELGRHVPRELDFLAEARNAERVAALLAGRSDVRVPRIHRRWSTRRVLVMEFVDAVKITDREALAAAGLEPDAVVRTLVDAWCQQVLVHGFFQADPHPGNLLVEPDGAGGARLVLLDFGLAKELPESFRLDVLALLMAVLRRDPDEMAGALETLGFATRDGSRESLAALARMGLEIVRELAESGSLGPERMERIGEELAEQVRRNPLVQVPSHMVLLGRALGLLSGVARSLRSRVDPLSIVFPYVVGSAMPLGRRPS
ncbi:MAG TPA: AarF/UbiB family protein [Myxococcota bacterium]|nr:AarF/UbiB family protein [Myxococcota bacterium]